MINIVFVGLGGFIGAAARYLMGLIPVSTSFPVITLIINFSGAVLISVITGYSYKITPINEGLMLFLKVGICGGFTTFSTFSLETMQLFDEGKILLGICYAASSVIICLIGILIGKYIIKYILI